MSTYRIDRGWGRRDEDGHTTHLAGPDDVSAYHHQYPTGYDSRCSWCWLGYSHSEDAHAASLLVPSS